MIHKIRRDAGDEGFKADVPAVFPRVEFAMLADDPANIAGPLRTQPDGVACGLAHAVVVAHAAHSAGDSRAMNSASA